MRISIIAAMSSNRVIGSQNKLPWDLPTDLNFFKSTTLNSIVIMGRKTFASIGKALPNRKNIVISRQTDFKQDGLETVANLPQAIELAKKIAFASDYKGTKEIFIIGGAQIYSLGLEFTDRIYLTEIQKHFDGDAVFPEFSKDLFRETSRSHHFENGVSFDFVIYDKN